MDTIKLENKTVQMIAHRGVSGLECENSCPAFICAGQRSYYGIETDVHITKDGKYIICHDDNISRVTGGVEKVIEESTFDELRAIPLVSPLDGATREDLYFPTLREYIDICKKYNKRAILEIKNRFTCEEVRGMLDIIKEAEYLENVTFISFSTTSLLNLRIEYPKADAQFLTLYPSDNTLKFIAENHFDLDIHHKVLSTVYVNEVHKLGLKVNCWTVNTPEEAAEAMRIGADFITTNILE